MNNSFKKKKKAKKKESERKLHLKQWCKHKHIVTHKLNTVETRAIDLDYFIHYSRDQIRYSFFLLMSDYKCSKQKKYIFFKSLFIGFYFKNTNVLIV